MAARHSGPLAQARVELVDCGDGRRLDRLGVHLIDRPAPGAIGPRGDPRAWPHADVRFIRRDGGRGVWSIGDLEGDPWAVDVDGLTMELRLAAGGQVGLFLEHVGLWGLVRRLVAARGLSQVLNLFAYTGGTTLAAASAGAEVVHLDASRTAVAWARRNALLSRLADRPIRWLADDADAFVRREGRRGSAYDLVVLDPPSFGRADRRPGWRLEARLPDLLRSCAALLTDDGLLLVSAHTPGFDGDRLAAAAGDAIAHRMVGRPGERGPGGRGARVLEAGPLDLRATSGAVLHAGAYALLATG